MVLNTKHKTLKWILIISIIISIGVVYYIFNPADLRLFPKCPFKQLTGFDCPGCGSQQAIHHILHFEMSKAFAANALLVLAIPYIIIKLTFDFINVSSPALLKLKRLFYGKWAVYFIIIVIVVYGVARNF